MVILRTEFSCHISLQKSTAKNSFHPKDCASDLDVTLKTTDSGHGGSSVGSHSPPNPINSEAFMRPSIAAPNCGPPPRHLLPAKLKPSPGVKMHPPAVILDFKGK